ncbi:rhomboid family intramembrane serine protease [Bifidobacterium dolichotidis]|uniref:Rhomboid family intramembrane serine protease n=1 Tax=Bifidobacterium dolichotidis TaxID=2306976 RepID=A0A430FQZ3_9BIFI|nr:rhomboid family intramembrane serine protease [Bifidobacterium dolichotidis]RSX55241.1 rhomboid family intramembrane serine protease [Bifidobacterium dolichotidis]
MTQRFSLFPDSPQLKNVFSARSVKVRWRSGAPVITEILIVTCVALWIIEMLLRMTWRPGLQALLGFTMLQPATACIHPWTFITSMFIHSPNSLWHIVFNMLTLWSVGPYLEKLMGHWSYLMLYLLSGIGGGAVTMAWAAIDSSGQGWVSGVYGASGAIFGLFAAMLVVYHNMHEDLRSMLVWMGINFLMPIIVPNVAWQAHIGGFVFGGLLTLLTIYGVRSLRYKPVIVKFGIYSAVLLVIAIILIVWSNSLNPFGWLL